MLGPKLRSPPQYMQKKKPSACMRAATLQWIKSVIFSENEKSWYKKDLSVAP